jgi:hypothetical protein
MILSNSPGRSLGQHPRWRAERPARTVLAALACSIALGGTAAASGPAWAATQASHRLSASSVAAQFSDVSCPARTSCVAVGNAVGKDGVARTLAERWDGHAWHIVASPNAAKAKLNALEAISCSSATACEAVGNSQLPGAKTPSILAERWNGNSWRMVPIQKPGATTIFNSVSCTTASACMAVGLRVTPGGKGIVVAERWNGRQWRIVAARTPAPLADLSGVSCPRPRNCTAVGFTSGTAGALLSPLVEHWNGARWSLVTVRGPRNSVLRSVSCPTATSCTAVGGTEAGDGGMLVADLSRSRWTFTRPTAAKPILGPQFQKVSCSAPRVCTAIVHYETLAGELSNTTATRGASGGWTVAVPTTDVSQNTLAGVSCRPVACTVVGGLNTTDGQGDSSGQGTTFAERGTGNHLIAQATPNP